MKFLISAGHSNVDPGAVENGVSEADLALDLRNIIANKLKDAGHDVVTDGKASENLPLKDALKLIVDGRKSIEIHFNASDNHSATGVECLSLKPNKAMSQKLSNAIAKVLGLKVRGDGGWRDQSESARGRLAFVNAGGIIVEVCFISNPVELDLYVAKKWLVASAIVAALTSA